LALLNQKPKSYELHTTYWSAVTSTYEYGSMGTNGGSGASKILYQDAFKIEKSSTNNDWVFKIPQAEINANPLITPADQNK
tara:strand:- start:209 stop:451 length:243 start_codon:yes stop_codon:yes gene_type:complete